jgi:predicted ATPase/class 3 adenylate cyclase
MDSHPAIAAYLFTDIAGSTKLWEDHPERMREALARHDAMTRRAVESHGGTIVKMVGDGAHAAFDDPLDAICAAVELQQALADPERTSGLALPVRCGVHVGLDERRDNDFFGRAVNRAARIMALAHGGQVLLSQAATSLVRERLPPGVTVRDLGSVTLRGLERPEQIHQLVHPALRETFPPLHSLGTPPNNLPLQTTSFIGRQLELTKVGSLLAETRLLTLLGPGGIGKTRLSLRLASETLADRPDGVWLVELAALTDPQLVPQAVASVLGLKEEGGRPVVDVIADHLGDRRLLLILDNCEHLTHSCAELAVRLLRAAPDVKILASSREPLGVSGETTYTVPLLTTPVADAQIIPESLKSYESTRLFLARATAAWPPFSASAANARAVADICRRLDGIPLAIELAAVHVRVLPVERIAERLSDRFRLLTRGDKTALPRQQTLRASIDWSYELLTQREQSFLCRLAVFAGGWTLEAAEAVGEATDAGDGAALDALANLVEKSLVNLDRDKERYRLLDTIRQYALERLRSSGDEAEARSRHLAFFVALVEDVAAGIGSPTGDANFSKLDVERENLLIAFDSCGLVGDGAQAGLRLASALRRWLVSRGLLGLGHRLTADAVRRAGAGARDLLRCRALCAALELAFLTGFYAEAKDYGDESVAIAREIDDRPGLAEALRLSGYVYLAHDDRSVARERFESALNLSRALGDKSRLAAALNGLAELHRSAGELDVARPLYLEAVQIDRDVGDRRRLAIHLCNLARVLVASERVRPALEVMLEALAIAEDIGSTQIRRALLECSAGLGTLYREWDLAARFCGAAQAQSERMGYHREPMNEAFLPPLLARAREALGDAAFAASESAGRALSHERAMSEARAWLEVTRMGLTEKGN